MALNVSSESKLRLFFAVRLSSEINQKIIEHVEVIRHRLIQFGKHPRTPKIKWVDSQNLHVTLKFLGSVSSDQVVPICKSVESWVNGLPSFEVEVGGLGAFPNEFSPRALWIGLRDSTSSLVRIAQEIELRMQAFGILPEGRSFHPHLTIGRVKEGKIERGFFDPFKDLHCGISTIQSVELYQSKTESAGAIYTEVARFCFNHH